MMTLATLSATASLLFAGSLSAQTPLQQVTDATEAATLRPATRGFVAGTHVYPYTEGVIYEAYAAPGFVTDLALQPGENLLAVASGDTARWVIGDTTSGGSESGGEAKRTHVLVKPFSAGLVTNLVITTDRRTYHVRLVSTGKTAISSVHWTYPKDELLALQRRTEAAQAAAPVANGLAVEQLHFNYAISGDRPGWRPLRAFDDGERTYVEFPPSLSQGDAPPLFVTDSDGKAELVNYRLRGRYYIVDRLFDAAELRLGSRKQQVVRIERVAPGNAGKGE